MEKPGEGPTLAFPLRKAPVNRLPKYNGECTENGGCNIWQTERGDHSLIIAYRVDIDTRINAGQQPLVESPAVVAERPLFISTQYFHF